MKKTIPILILMLLPVFASAQLKSQENGIDLKNVLRYGINPIGLVSNSLLDPNKFHISQSYTIAMSSMGGQSISQAMYLNTMSYQISNPLSVSLQWGFLMNQPFGGQNNNLGYTTGLPYNNGFFISGAQLKYTPSENTQIKLEFRQVPYNPYYYDYYRNPYFYNNE